MVNLAASVTGHRVRHPARGAGARAAPDRGPQAALQPPQPPSREDALAQADRRALAAAVPGPQGRRGRRRLPRPVRLAPHGREVPGRPARGVPDPPVQRPAADHAHTVPLRARRDGAVPLPVRRQRLGGRTTQRWWPRSATTCCASADQVVEALTARMDRLAVDERFEEAGVHRDRLSAFVRAASRTQRLGSLSSCAELVAARREDDRRWAVHVVRHGRLAASGVIPPDAHAGVWVTQLRESAETVAAGPGPDPRRQRRGVRADPALARAARRPAGARRRRVDLPGPRRHPAPRRARRRGAVPRRAGALRRAPAPGHRPPALTRSRRRAIP